ncbi:MAG: putative hydroxymethylpyrimidine transport system substrate-binding protein [Thermoleophilaceae bacterium]|jgi:NitT/TauT family transport system substrate-binding protein/putative hydroxymethylpyrimidine transport system substrate-binding protein|nr:putative hydroxymethylpyrimidine transport system substrate-binding protein [Thermoleophilaceae bacterium]
MSFALRLSVAAIALLLAGCGGGSGGADRPARIAIDFTPNAVHAPIYAAKRLGLDRKHGIDLQIRGPGGSPDSLKLLLSGKVDMAVMDIHDLGLAVEKGSDVVGVGALVKRPLAAIITPPDVKRPRDLEGRRVGVSGLPSDPAVLKPVIQSDGGDFSKLRLVTIGFSAVPSLLTHKVDGVPAFWNVEGVLLKQRGFNPNEFRLDDYGAPPYPEVVLAVRRATLDKDRALVEDMLAAFADGSRAVLHDPGAAATDVARAAGADLALIDAQLRALRPVVNPSLRLDRGVLDRWAAFDARFGILKKRPDVGATFDLTAAP